VHTSSLKILKPALMNSSRKGTSSIYFQSLKSLSETSAMMEDSNGKMRALKEDLYGAG
jgi:hypothetical protein